MEKTLDTKTLGWMPNEIPYLAQNLDNKDYHLSGAVSKSLLDQIHLSPWHYEMARQGVIEKHTNALDMGSAVHLAVLQPHLFDRQVVCGPPDRRGKKWTEVLEANAGKIVLIEEDYNEVFSIRQSVADHPIAQTILEKSDKVEYSYFWHDPITQIACKCRPDLTIWPGVIGEGGILVDLKVIAANNGSLERFQHYIEDYSYDMQAAFYLDGVSRTTQEIFAGFIFLVVEKETHLVSIFNLEAQHDYVTGGRMRYTKRLLDLRDYFNHPPAYLGYPAKIQEVPVRSWYKKQLEEGELS